MMDLGMQGQELLSATAEYTVSLEFTGRFFVQIESPFVLRTPSGTVQLSPDEDPKERFEPLQGLVGQNVNDAVADDAGVLKLTFENGAELSVSPDGEYEAWTMAGPRGMTVVCMPSGGITVWSPDPEI